jgi:hypothetical protein
MGRTREKNSKEQSSSNARPSSLWRVSRVDLLVLRPSSLVIHKSFGAIRQAQSIYVHVEEGQGRGQCGAMAACVAVGGGKGCLIR